MFRINANPSIQISILTVDYRCIVAVNVHYDNAQKKIIYSSAVYYG